MLDVGDIKHLNTTAVHLSYSRDNPRAKASGPSPPLHSYMKPEPKATSYKSEGALQTILAIHVKHEPVDKKFQSFPVNVT